MDASPLVQQARPSFQPKIASLYEDLFNDDGDDEELGHSEGFWQEFFLLRPDKRSLSRRLAGVSADGLLHSQHETQQLFLHAVQQMKFGKAPSDEVALDVMFLAGVLAKRYTNPSADIITVLAGLDVVDAVFSDFANAIESIILAIRQKAIEVALSLTSGAYNTSLVSYFTHRDLFPPLIKYIQDSDTPDQIFEPFLLLGLLANYNKFEYRNPYKIRLEDFVNESNIQKIVGGLGDTCTRVRSKYIAVQEDLPEGWNVSNTLSYIGLGVLAPVKAIVPISATDDSKEREEFAALPDPLASLLLSTYDFAQANKLFCSTLLSTAATSKSRPSPFSAYLSLISYILHHASRSPRATLYGRLSLLTLRTIIEDPLLCRSLFAEVSIPVRLCRQRPPFLPFILTSRPAAAQIVDIVIDTLNHNLRRRLDIDLYTAALHLIHRLICFLSQTRTRFPYHWSFLWQCLLSVVRFLVTYSPDLSTQPNLSSLLAPLINSLTLAASAGNAFLPDPAAYDDLFYKLVEASDHLVRFKKAYYPSRSSADAVPLPIDNLIHISQHYNALLETARSQGKMGKNLSPREVTKVIRQGYESLDVSFSEGLDGWERYREGEERGLLKKCARVAVEDARKVVGGFQDR
ncbi:hypothetical protein MMC20_003672 [Loxospora ochrophaea]|nr:hypothetical protein [Loxospora ochrophaea]